MPINEWMIISKKLSKKFIFDIFGEKEFKDRKKLKADGVKLSTTEFYNENLIINL